LLLGEQRLNHLIRPKFAKHCFRAAHFFPDLLQLNKRKFEKRLAFCGNFEPFPEIARIEG
jgi:hypothetical protein